MRSIEFTYDTRKLRQAFQKSASVLNKHMRQGIDCGVLEISREARLNAPKAHSLLTNAITVRQPNPLTGEVVAGKQYARMVEEGTAAGGGGWPSQKTMIDWIKVHKIEPNDPGMDIDDLAYVMARSIALRGTPKQPYLVPAFNNKKARVQQLIDQSIDLALAEIGA